MKLLKKGEMTSGQIVSLVLVIVGFLILLLVYSQIRPTKSVDRETCRLSVVEKTSAEVIPVIGNSAKRVVPLKCKTKKICLTSKVFGRGDCEAELGKEFETYRITSDVSKQDSEVNRFLAQEMVDCWKMMGEGKLSVFSKDSKFTKKCSLCSRVSFDSGLKHSLNNEFEGLGEYLKTRNVPNQEVTYWDVLTWSRDLSKERIVNDKYSTNQKAILYVEFKQGTLINTLSTIFGIGGGALAGAYAGGAVGSIVPVVGTAVGASTGALIGFVGGSIFGGVGGSKVGESVSDSALVNYLWGTNLKNKADSAAANFMVDYDAEKLSGVCSSLESIA